MTTSQGWLRVAARAGSCHISPRVGRRVPFVWPLLRPRYAPGNRSFLVYLNRPWEEMEGERGGACVSPSGMPRSRVSAFGLHSLWFYSDSFKVRLVSPSKMRQCARFRSLHRSGRPSREANRFAGSPSVFFPSRCQVALWLLYSSF